MSIFKYPLRPPASRSQAGTRIADSPTEATDYLMLRRERFSYNDKDVPNFYKRNSPGNQQTVLQHPDRCYIAVPPQIAVPEPSKYVSFLDTPNIFPAISTSMNAPITYKEIKRK